MVWIEEKSLTSPYLKVFLLGVIQVELYGIYRLIISLNGNPPLILAGFM